MFPERVAMTGCQVPWEGVEMGVGKVKLFRVPSGGGGQLAVGSPDLGWGGSLRALPLEGKAGSLGVGWGDEQLESIWDCLEKSTGPGAFAAGGGPGRRWAKGAGAAMISSGWVGSRDLGESRGYAHC